MAASGDFLEVDLRSDTFTKPTPAMRKAMAEAIVGDDVYREDPTVIKLEKMVAERLGKEAALFVPTGTMGNECAIMAHCWERGRETIVGDLSHIYLFEQGAAAQLAGVLLRSLRTKPDGTFDLDELREVICPNPDTHGCITGLICLENTNNRCGGVTLSMEYVSEVCRLAKSHGIPVHMDGARICNAALYLGLPVATLVKDCDSVSMCLSKGIGAPVGSVVAGRAEFIDKVLRCRKVLGGAMRQVGVLAAAGIVAFDDLEERLLRDHQHALKLARAVADMKSSVVSVNLPSVHTNMVVLHFAPRTFTSEEFESRMKKVDDEEARTLGRKISVKISTWNSTQIRCVFHSDIPTADADEAIRKMKYVIEELTRKYGKNHETVNGVDSTTTEGLKGVAEDSNNAAVSQKFCKSCLTDLTD